MSPQFVLELRAEKVRTYAGDRVRFSGWLGMSFWGFRWGVEGARVAIILDERVVETVRTDRRGGFSTVIEFLDAGRFRVKAYSKLWDVFEVESKPIEMEIVKPALTLGVDKKETYAGDEVTAEATLVWDRTALPDVRVSISADDYRIAEGKTDKGGRFRGVWKTVDPGVYKVLAEHFLGRGGRSEAVEVRLVESKLRLEADRREIYEGEWVALRATLTWNGHPISGRGVDIRVDERVVGSGSTDARGVFETEWVGKVAGDYVAKARHGLGRGGWSNAVPIKVKPVTRIVKVEMREPKVVYGSPAKLKSGILLRAFIQETGAPLRELGYKLDLDGVEVRVGYLDIFGEDSFDIDIEKHMGRLRASLLDFPEVFGEMVFLWDDFEDGEVDKKLWRKFGIASPLTGKYEIKETGPWKKPPHWPAGKLVIFCKNWGHGGGLYTKDLHDLTDAVVSAKLYSDHYVTAWISLNTEATEKVKAFYPAPHGKAYHVGIWEKGVQKVLVGAEKKWLKLSKELPANPCNIMITTFDDKFTVYVEGEKFYEEDWRFETKRCEIRIWAVAWYLEAIGWSWIDDVIVTAGRLFPREIPWEGS